MSGAAFDNVPAAETEEPDPGYNVIWWCLASGVLLLLLIAALFYSEHASRAYDADTQRASAQRIVHYGRGYFIDATDQKGPLWLFFYHMAWLITDGAERFYWFVIAIFSLILSAITAIGIGAIARVPGPRRFIIAAVSASTFLYLVFGREEFSGILYSRNITVALLAVALALLVNVARNRTHVMAKLTIAGACTGLVVQTMPASALTVVGLFSTAALLMPTGEERLSLVKKAIRLWPFVVASIISFSSVFVWFALRHELRNFWQEWYTYNKIYSDATGMGPVQQLMRGLTNYGNYYAAHLVYAVVIVLFFIQTGLIWKKGDPVNRYVRASLIVWFFGESLSVVLAQRFFDHYLLMSFVPIAAMAAVLARDISLGLPIVAMRSAALLGLAMMLIFTWPNTRDGFRKAQAFNNAQAYLWQQHTNTLGPQFKTARAISDLYTAPNDPVYSYGQSAFMYTAINRMSPTRYIESRWLTGQIYLQKGATRSGISSKYVLSGTSERWQDDMNRANPALVFRQPFLEIIQKSPPMPAFVSNWTAPRFSPLFAETELSAQVRNDLWRPGQPLPGPTTPVEQTAGVVPVGSCRALSGSISVPTTASSLTLAFGPDTLGGTSIHVKSDGVKAIERFGRAPSAVNDANAIKATADGSHSFTLLVGTNAAMLVVDGNYAVATLLPNERSVASVNLATSDGATITNMATSPSPLPCH